MDEKQVAKIISDAHGRLYLVGGALRDEVMGSTPHDKDYCVTGMDEETFRELFPHAKMVGKDFSVFLLDTAEIAFARKEKKVSSGHRGFSVNTSKDITIEDDLKRRDFTINAMAKDVLTDKIIDPYGGREDIKKGIIRHVSDAFCEDPLRVYRAARFAAKLNFKVDKDTLRLMNTLKRELKSITPERVCEELKKALATDTPSIFFDVLREAQLLDVHFKEINDLIGIPQPEKYHPEGDVYNHAMIVLDRVSKSTEDIAIRFGALVHDLGKAKTPQDILPQHLGHETAGVPLVGDLSNRLKLPNRFKKVGKEACKYHMKASICTSMRPYKQAKFFQILSKSNIGLDGMQMIVNADDMIDRPKIDFATIAKATQKAVNGDILKKEGITPQTVGVEKFNTMLLERQAKYIEEIEMAQLKKEEYNTEKCNNLKLKEELENCREKASIQVEVPSEERHEKQ